MVAVPGIRILGFYPDGNQPAAHAGVFGRYADSIAPLNLVEDHMVGRQHDRNTFGVQPADVDCGERDARRRIATFRLQQEVVGRKVG